MCIEVGIHKRKQESKKTRKLDFHQEKDKEKKIVFLAAFLVESVFSYFFSYFPVFFYKFPPLSYYIVRVVRYYQGHC